MGKDKNRGCLDGGDKSGSVGINEVVITECISKLIVITLRVIFKQAPFR